MESCVFDGRIYTVSSDVATRTVDNDTIVLDLRTERYFALNETGARIWTTIEEGHSLDALPDRLVDETGVDPEQVRADTRELLDQLVDAGLIERRPA